MLSMPLHYPMIQFLIFGTFRLDYDYEIEYQYDVQTSDISRALVLHAGFRQKG